MSDSDGAQGSPAEGSAQSDDECSDFEVPMDTETPATASSQVLGFELLK